MEEREGERVCEQERQKKRGLETKRNEEGGGGMRHSERNRVGDRDWKDRQDGRYWVREHAE